MAALPQKTIALLNDAITTKNGSILIQMLHVNNKNCRRLFERATEIKLPKTVTRTNEFIKSWCSGEDYIEPTTMVRYEESPKVFISKPILHKMLGI